MAAAHFSELAFGSSVFLFGDSKLVLNGLQRPGPSQLAWTGVAELPPRIWLGFAGFGLEDLDAEESAGDASPQFPCLLRSRVPWSFRVFA